MKVPKNCKECKYYIRYGFDWTECCLDEESVDHSKYTTIWDVPENIGGKHPECPRKEQFEMIEKLEQL